MTAAVRPPTTAELAPDIATACARIAPTWPLDRMIAVNPFWGFIQRPITDAAAELAGLSGATLLMPRRWYREQWRAERFAARHLAAAIAQRETTHAVDELIASLEASDEPLAAPQGLLVAEVVDAGRDLGHALSWHEYVVRHISQTCAAYFDEGQAAWMPSRDGGLYTLWRELARHDGGPRLLMGLKGFREAAAALPGHPIALITEAVSELEIPAHHRARYFTALLLSVGGWASACAFRRWEARLAGSDDDQIVHLLAVRLAWELILARLADRTVLHPRWDEAKAAWGDVAPTAAALQQDDWVFQRALELAYQERVAEALTSATPTRHRPPAPSAQVVFCIDVRSEVFRRALEQAQPAVQTLGFAGFFGLPIAYQPLHGTARAQLPGLLAPGMVVADQGATRDDAARRTIDHASLAAAVKGLGRTPSSTFSFVEAAGLGWAASLLRDGFALGEHAGDPLRGAAARALHPTLAAAAGSDEPLDLATRTTLAAGILRAMSLTSDFAPVLALLGHGASTANNPQAAGLHCGACGGQTGEVNARAAAALLNDPSVREGLRAEGIDLGSTIVVPGLHDTTRDIVILYDLDTVPPSRRAAIESLQQALRDAGVQARRERAAALGLAGREDDALNRAVDVRGRDWSEVRPEWGLANNAAFVVAPRERTRGINLAGRSFLHEYRWEEDAGFGVLELIMTAPMVVTHWINMQYHASTVDPVRYGSGNKVLHNVVGGRLGVMEGAGGDLRIGLALQSVHDGETWRHEPLRLSVFIEAPAEAIDGIIARHEMLQQLVGNEWLFLHRIDPATGDVTRRSSRGWVEVMPGAPALTLHR
ncbi:MAG TPA: DUF2309 domain-containing protein [Gemmatimonadales bacterium]|nr:DUF2309 domain-containing protein [Gemmatimonadales bacterium]